MSDEPTTITANVRGELLALISRDLVGPWDGPDEVILGTPRARYLAGALAPISVLDGATPSAAITTSLASTSLDDIRNDEDLAVADLSNAHEVDGVPVDEDNEIVEASSSDSDEDRGPESKIIAPSSMGLRFQVSPGNEQLRFTARWGKYSSRREADDDGRIQTYYDRTPFAESVEIDLSTVSDGGSIRRELVDGVAISIEVFDHEGRRVVEAALLNTTVTGRELPPRLWMFQAELEVRPIDDTSGIFLPTRDALVHDRGSRDLEVQRLDLLYRDRLEFAVGRTASATGIPPVKWSARDCGPHDVAAHRRGTADAGARC